jgi:NAD(P)H-flavin reductase
VLRVSKNEGQLKKDQSGIEFTRDYFENRVVSEATVSDFSRVWICGPPRMATETAKILLQSDIPRESFLLL